MKKFRGCWRKAAHIVSLVLVISICTSIWSFTCLAEGANDEDDTDDKRIMVSMGDSFSAGEGIKPFYGQNERNHEKVNNPDWLAHRSQKAWAGMLSLPSVSGKMADHKDENWFFVAASGAETKHMLNSFRKDAKKGKIFVESTDPEVVLEPQLNVFNRIGKNKTDYVTLTLGGNDAGFTGVISKCVLRGKAKKVSDYLSPGELSDQLNDTWDRFWKEGGIRDDLHDAYKNISDRAGSNAQIIVVGYPQLLNPDGGVMINKNEAELVNKNVTEFNNAIEGLVKQCQKEGMQINFVSVEKAFKGHGAYSKDSYLNEVMYYLDGEDITDFAMPPVSAFSMHPNEKGARAYADCVQRKINELESIANGKLNNDFTVSVFDINGELYNNYIIKIEGEEFTGLLKWGFFHKPYSRTIDADKSQKVHVNLPKGNYTVTIVDKSNASNQCSRDILVRPVIKNAKLEFRTNFGEHGEKPDQEGKADQGDTADQGGTENQGGTANREDTNTNQNEKLGTLYRPVIKKLETEYGNLRIARTEENGYEANGLCYLNLVDFTRDGKDELMAVCKKENEEHYTGTIYSVQNGNAELIYENDRIEFKSGQIHDEIVLSYTDESGYVFETGWTAASGDGEDQIFYWYDGDGFSQVYRSKGYWDNSQQKAVIEENLKIIDLYDDEHRDQLWDNMSVVCVRSLNDEFFDEQVLHDIIRTAKNRLNE